MLVLSIILTGIPAIQVQAASKPVISSSQVKIKKNACSVKKGKKIKLAAKYGKKDITKKGTWKSSKKSVATISKTGVLTAKKAGKKAVTITAKVDGVSLTCKVTVKNAPKKISLNAKSKTLKKGKTFKIKVKFPKNTASNKLTYKSSNSKVAKVDANGKIKAVKKGKATIMVTTFNKKKAKLKVTVK